MAWSGRDNIIRVRTRSAFGDGIGNAARRTESTLGLRPGRTFAHQHPSINRSRSEPSGIRGGARLGVRPYSVPTLQEFRLGITERIALQRRPIDAAFVGDVQRTRGEG